MNRSLAASLLMGSFDGVVVPPWLLALVEEGLGGVCLFAQNVVDDAQVAAVCAALHAARPDVVIAIDEEGGDVTRLDASTGSWTPCPAAFGYVDDVALTRAAYRSLGARLASLGIDLSLAPLADVNSNPRNPIIGVRSFGSTSAVVSRHVVAAVSGFHLGGVAACVKHYPGHGDTVADTHLGLARVEGPLEDQLVPFGAAVDGGVDAVLTAHVVTEFDDRPASLSRRWTERLRETFDGVIVTDALDMGAVSGGGVPAAAVAALQADADFLCLGSNFDAAMTADVIDAIVDADLDHAAMEESAARIAKMRRHADRTPPIDLGAAAEVAGRAVVVDGVIPSGLRTMYECRPQPSMACFNVTWGVAQHLDWPVNETAADVIVVRDLDVHLSQRTVIEALHPRVVVELGWPSAIRPPCDAYIVTHGAALSSTRAVASLLEANRG
jgi:beta-N-acetylhexosaminidase